MSLEDPYFIVKDEVYRALIRIRGLYTRYREVGNSNTVESVWITNELRNSLRTLEWDLEDLEDTITIVEKNRSKFNIEERELSSRQHFIDSTRNEVKSMKDSINFQIHQDKLLTTSRQPLLAKELQEHQLNNINSASSRIIAGMTRHSGTKYSKLENSLDSPGHFANSGSGLHSFVSDNDALQQRMVLGQDEQLDVISDSIGTLKTVSRQINSELDEQAVMLDDFGNELDTTESKIDSTMKKVAKVLRMNNDSRQWMAIGILSALLFIVIILLIIL